MGDYASITRAGRAERSWTPVAPLAPAPGRSGVVARGLVGCEDLAVLLGSSDETMAGWALACAAISLSSGDAARLSATGRLAWTRHARWLRVWFAHAAPQHWIHADLRRAAEWARRFGRDHAARARLAREMVVPFAGSQQGWIKAACHAGKRVDGIYEGLTPLLRDPCDARRAREAAQAVCFLGGVVGDQVREFERACQGHLEDEMQTLEMVTCAAGLCRGVEGLGELAEGALEFDDFRAGRAAKLAFLDGLSRHAATAATPMDHQVKLAIDRGVARLYAEGAVWAGARLDVLRVLLCAVSSGRRASLFAMGCAPDTLTQDALIALDKRLEDERQVLRTLNLELMTQVRELQQGAQTFRSRLSTPGE